MAYFYQILTWVIFKPQKLYHLAVEWQNDPGATHLDLLWNLEHPVLIQTLSCRRKITGTTYLYWLAFSVNSTVFNADVRHMFHSHVAHQLPSIYMQQWVIFPVCQWQWCWAEQTTSIWIWHWSKINKILLDLLKFRTKAEKPDIQL